MVQFNLELAYYICQSNRQISLHEEEIILLCFNLLQVKVEELDDDAGEEEREEEDLEKALSVERFGDIIGDSASTNGDRMGRRYTEKDFECKACFRLDAYESAKHSTQL